MEGNYDRIIKNINSIYNLPKDHSSIFLTSIESAQMNQQGPIVNPIRLKPPLADLSESLQEITSDSSSNEDPEVIEKSAEELKIEAEATDLIAKMKGELRLQQSMVEDLEHYLDYHSVFYNSEPINTLSSNLNVSDS